MGKKVKVRQAAITQLIKNQPIADQHTLVELIKAKYGLETNQAVVSRDLRALGVTKRAVGQKLIYELQENDASREILRLAVVSINHNESLIVVKTLPGLASFVGDYLDMNGDLEIMGTIAGENTLFVAPRHLKEIEKTFKKISSILYVKESHE